MILGHGADNFARLQTAVQILSDEMRLVDYIGGDGVHERRQQRSSIDTNNG